MAVTTKEFKENILDEMEYYNGFTRPKYAFFLERLLVAKAPISKLHPNPDDEFTNPEIGPSSRIVGEYTKNIVSYNKYETKEPKIEPIIVEKLSTGEYMILNGHHRWLAAKKLNMKRVPIQIVNSTHDTDVLQMLKKLKSEVCVSFNLDKVLLSENGEYPVEKIPDFLKNLFPWPIRKDTRILMDTIKDMRFDIWVYTSKFCTPQYIRLLFAAHRIKVDGVISGMNSPDPSPVLKNAFRRKYRSVVHVDNEHIIWVDTKTKEFDSLSLAEGEKWADEVAAGLQKLLKEHTDGSDSI